uniref:Zinc finger protein 865 n=1 Tax=Electrophorus electricus TaxID=8005 RepID=A0A4W4DTX3_ELEEL
MDKQQLPRTEAQGFRLPLSSLRLLVPPLHLMSAFMWQVLQQKNVLHYGKLEEFVSMVTENVPQLMSYRQRAQLILGLRARMILEMLRGPVDVKVIIQAHLDRMGLPAVPAGCSVDIDSDLELSVANFKALVLELLKDPAEKAYFFQAVFPVQYGPRYDTALKELMWELLSCLERLLPVPDFKKTLSWLTPAPAGLDECIESEPKYLQELLQQHKVISNVDNQYWSKGSKLGTALSISGDCILSSLSIPPSTHVVVPAEPTVYHMQPTTVTILSQGTLGQLGSEAIIVTDYAEVELSTNDVLEEVSEAAHGGVEDPAAKGAVNVESRSVVAILTEGGTLGEEDEMMAMNQQVELGEEMKKALCEKSVQCDLRMEFPRDGGGLLSPSCLGAAESSENDESVRTDMERQSEIIGQKDIMHTADASLGASGQANCTLSGNKSLSEAGTGQVLPPRRGRGRPRKNTVAPKVVQPGRRRGRPPTVKAEKEKNEEDIGEKSGTSKPEAGQNGMETTLLNNDRCPTTTKSCKTETIENPRARYLCNTCGRKFTRTSDVRRHQLTHTGERPFHCTQCAKTFQHAWDLTKHCRKFHGEATFSCRLCTGSFVNLRTLTAHHKKSHTSELPHYCSICGEASSSAVALAAHRRTHSVTQQYRCEQCGEGFDTLLQRSAHRQSHRRHRKFKCPQCDKTYSRRADVKRHLLSHTGERPHQCALCGKSFALRSGLQKHHMTHTGERPYRCPHCPKAFNLISILHRHERMHTGERPFLCSQCGKRFLSLGELLKHDKSHTDERPHACSQCHKRFKSKRALREHALSHTGARPYACSYCSKRFTKPFALNRHHLMHTGERPFSCAHCAKTFLTATEVALHERVHTGERPYACPTCPWRFRSSSELARHRRTHTQARAHACGYCSKTYTSAAKLKSHARIHAAQDNSKCPVDISHTVEVHESTLHESEVADALS